MVFCFGHFHFSEHEKLQCPQLAKAHNRKRVGFSPTLIYYLCKFPVGCQPRIPHRAYICLLSATRRIILIWTFLRLPIVCNFLPVTSLVYYVSTLKFITGCSVHLDDLDFYRLPIVYNLKCLHIKNISILIISIYDFFLLYNQKILKPIFDTKIKVKASQRQYLCGLWGFLKILSYTLHYRFFRLCTNIFHFFDRNDFLRCVKTKRVM